MKVFIALFALVAVAVATDVPILKNVQDVHADGSFSFAYETGDGISHSATGDLEAVHGSYKFASPEGEQFDTSYTADKDGYKPTGPHIHNAEQILRAIEYIHAHPPQGLEQGAYVE